MVVIKFMVFCGWFAFYVVNSVKIWSHVSRSRPHPLGLPLILTKYDAACISSICIHMHIESIETITISCIKNWVERLDVNGFRQRKWGEQCDSCVWKEDMLPPMAKMEIRDIYWINVNLSRRSRSREKTAPVFLTFFWYLSCSPMGVGALGPNNILWSYVTSDTLLMLRTEHVDVKSNTLLMLRTEHFHVISDTLLMLRAEHVQVSAWCSEHLRGQNTFADEGVNSYPSWNFCRHAK